MKLAQAILSAKKTIPRFRQLILPHFELQLSGFTLDLTLHPDLINKNFDTQVAHLDGFITQQPEDSDSLTLLDYVKQLRKACRDHLKPPPPTKPKPPQLTPLEYAKDWSKHQTEANTDAHYCLRPPELKGLPLEILHPAFVVFKKCLAETFPPPNMSTDSVVINAGRAADVLCSVMGGDLPGPDQGDAFEHGLEDLFPRDGWKNNYACKTLPIPKHAKLDGVYLDLSTAEPRIRLIRRDQAENEYGPQPYIQAIHDYCWLVHRSEFQEPSHQENGAATLLMLVQGANLLIAGAIFDGQRVVAEPLSPFLPMLTDWRNRFNERREMLARYLYATRLTYDELLKAKFNVPYVPGIPHPSIYETIQDGRSDTLKFHSPHPFYANHTLLFNGTATFDEGEPLDVAIKLIYGHYGYEVHKYLASEGVAPQLYGKSISQFQPPSGPTIIPTAIVMENLTNPYETSSEIGWIPLYTFLEYHKDLSSGDQKNIFDELFKIVKLLYKKQFVHGDLRSPNFMIKVKGTHPDYQEMVPSDNQLPQVMVIDFDWAGSAGEVQYPRSRSDRKEWPGKPGGVILLEDDWILVKNWWSQDFPLFDISGYALPSPSNV